MQRRRMRRIFDRENRTIIIAAIRIMTRKGRGVIQRTQTSRMNIATFHRALRSIVGALRVNIMELSHKRKVDELVKFGRHTSRTSTNTGPQQKRIIIVEIQFRVI